MAYLTQFSIPGLLNPMINKMADEVSAILLLICSHKLWVKLTYDWFTALLVLMLALVSKNGQVRSSCAYAYAYVPLKTRLKE